jgi:hypothetical protein
LNNCPLNLRNLLLLVFGTALFSVSVVCQIVTFGPNPSLAETDASVVSMPSFDISTLAPGSFGEDTVSSGVAQDRVQHKGVVSRSVKRTLEDQKELYLAPFKPSNFKWDALVLAGTAVLLVADRHIENNLPGGHYQFYQDSSNIAIGGLAASLAGVWIYGIKGDHPHAKELGYLELETLVNTFLIYAPMQFIAGRQRPGEGNGHGDFLRHSGMNTSFPGGHGMFTWAMATVAAHEYPKPWVQALAYTAALTVTASRFLARDHWSSDMFVGSALGIAIGTHIFHSRCDPEISDSCRHHLRKFKMLDSPQPSRGALTPTEDIPLVR